MTIKVEYDRLLSEIQNVNENYHLAFSDSPTIPELSRMTGATEEKILESMEFGSVNHSVTDVQDYTSCSFR